MNLNDVVKNILNKAFKYLPSGCDSVAARLLLLVIGLQESRFEFRRQMITKVVDGKKTLVPEGPAVSFWQFEEGNSTSRGGVWGVLNHFRVGIIAKAVCREFGVAPDAHTVWKAMQTDDVLAACFARLLLLADAQKLPAVGDVEGAWKLYAERAWRPGKPHKETWAGFYSQARKELGV